MVAIVSGNSLGLGQTSLATLGQHGLVGTSQHGRNGQAAFVNVATGNLVVQNHDDHLVGAGADIASVRTYNSRGMTDDADNWVMSLARPPLLLTGTVNTAGSTLVRTAGDGATATYGFDEAAGRYVSYEGEGAYDQITFDGARYTWTDGSTAATEVYAGSAPLRLLQSLDAAGKGFTYHYDEAGRLKAAVAGNGEETRYVHDGNLLTQVSTFDSAGRRTGTRVRYAYDAEQRLVKVTVDLSPADGAVADGKAYVTAYTYHGASKRVASITQDDGNKLAFSYDGPDDRLSKITDALGNVTTIAYGVADASGNTRTQVTDAQGLVTTYEVDAAGRLTRIVPPAGGPATAFAYDAKGNVASVTNGAGAVTTFGYDARGNRDMERDATGATIRRTFNDRNFVLTETVAGPGPQTTRHIYDASNKLLRFTVSAAGRVTEHAYEDGRRVSTKVYAAKFFLGPAFTETALARWAAEYGAASIQRTEMTYDARGQLSSRTSDGAVETFIHDRAGRLLTRVAAGGGATHYTYDYFGVLKSHKDLGGGDFTYTHDNAGQLTLRRSTDRAQDIVYGYDAAGQVTRIEDTDRNKVTTYVYDLAGRRVREKVVQNRTTYQDNFLSYDAQGRLRDVADARVHIAMDYDGVGNRTRISTRVNYQGVTKEVTDSSVRYFQYDEMNRQTVVDGIDEKGNIGAEQGHKVTYDKNGNRVQDVFHGNRVATTENVIEGYDEDGTVIYSAKSTTFKTTFGKSTETYRYDNLNRLMSVTRDGIQIDVRRYDGADRVIRSGPFAVHPDYAEALNKNVDPGEAHSQDVRINRYDDNGRLLHQRIQSSDGRKLKTDISWDPTERDDDHKDYVANGYDEAGNVRSYVVISHEGGGATEYKTKLARFEGYQTLTTTANASRRDDGLTTHEYDANGFLVGVKDATQNDNNRVFVNDSEGRVLAAKQEGHMRRQLIANGEVLGSYGVGVDPLEPFSGRNNTPNFADFADFNFGYARISAGYPSASPGAYQVQTGDSLQGIAQSAYGDSSLWYRIAEANGLSSSTDLRVGQTITIPNRVGTISNNSTTFKPYDAGLMVGDTTPNMPTPSGGGGGGCGGVGQLVMAIVAVVATVFTAGLLAPVVAGAAGGVGFGATMSAGIAGLSSGSIGFVGGAVAAGVGSVASQLVGLATGSIEQLSWKSVALSAVSGGFSSGMASLANGGSLLAEPIVRGAVVNAASQGIGVVTGLQQRFSWRGVAASAVGAGIGQAVGPAFGGAFGSTAAGEFGARLAMGLVAGTAAAVMRGGKVAIQQVAVDAFGNALGQSILDKATFEDPLGALVKEEVAGQDRADRYALSTGSNPIGLHTGGGSGFKTTQQGYANWSASINERVQSAALRSEVEFMPELHADGTRPVYDFGDPFAGGGDVVAANGAAVQMRAGNGVTVGGPGLQLGERISNGLQARGFKKNADADAYDRFMRTGMDLFGSKFVQQAIRAGDLPGGPGDLLIGLVGIGKAGQQAIRAADDASYLVQRMFIGGAREAGPLRELEVGTYKELNSIRRTFGTAGTYDVDHIPSKAALRIAREDELGRSLTAAEVRQIESEGIGVVIGRDMHRDSRTYAGRNNALKIDDAANLHQAVRNDLNVFIGNAAARGLSEYQIMKTVAAAVMKNRQAGVMK